MKSLNQKFFEKLTFMPNELTLLKTIVRILADIGCIQSEQN